MIENMLPPPRVARVLHPASEAQQEQAETHRGAGDPVVLHAQIQRAG
ncbi:hypothetical protein ACLBX9_27045 [Methylobacterium sp. A49B]